MREDSIMPTHWTENFRIARAHPALSGHFPGRPVVPGVTLLDRVAAAVENRTGAHIAALPQVKFLRPLLPEQDATLTLEASGRSIRFHIAQKDETIATGVATLDADAQV
jgi:3-hydroxymyristoyl/3-hydroxydecanoyl-(acyl carrier protein) dehydratase